MRNKSRQHKEMQKAEIEKAYGDQKHFWALIKKHTPRNLSTDSISAKQWYDYYKELLNPSIEPEGGESSNFSEFVASYIACHDNTCVNCDSNENNHHDELLKQLNTPIHESEIREQIDKAKRGKSLCADGILNELIKLAKEKLIPILKMLFNTTFDYSIFPSSWRLGIITSIFKKGHRNNPANYRSISLLSNLGKATNRHYKH